MRDILFLCIVAVWLPMAAIRPYLGVYLWSWIGYLNPHRYAWGGIQSFPLLKIVAGVTVLGVLVGGMRVHIPRKKEFWIFLLLWGIFTVSTYFSLDPQVSWGQWFNISKIFLFTLLAILLLDEEKKFRAFIWIFILSLGIIGVKGGIFSFLSGGQYRIYGPPGSFLEDNNAVGLALNMVLPIIYYFAQDQSNKWIRFSLYMIGILTFISILFTYSRGALVGLVVVLFMLLIKSKRKLLGIPLLIIIGLVTLVYLPEKWMDKMSTIKNYQQDSSVMGRFQAWEFAVNLANDRPLTGGGFGSFNQNFFNHYTPGYQARASHSIYFQILAEHGYIGVFVFLLLIGTSYLSLRRVRKNSSSVSIHRYCNMLEISIVAYIVSGAFLSFGYFDFYYHIIACSILIQVIAEKDMNKPEELKNGISMNNNMEILVNP